EPYPLSPVVGQAIIRYLKEAWPQSLYREVFLTVEAPIQPLRGSSVWTIVAKRTSALEPPMERRGPHALRHASATHLLAEGFSLKQIGDHLGHRLQAQQPLLRFEVWHAARILQLCHHSRLSLHITLTRRGGQTAGSLYSLHLFPGGTAEPPRRDRVLSETQDQNLDGTSHLSSD